jgi:hypothetical protein
MRRALPCAALAAIAAGMLGCGGVRAADLFEVRRTGQTPAALALVVDEEGHVTCNGRKGRDLADLQLVQARAIQEELQSPASQQLRLGPEPGSVHAYVVRDENGEVHFADNSANAPKVLHSLELFVLQVAQQDCGLPE